MTVAPAPAADSHPVGTRGPKRSADWDAVLDRWAEGKRAGEIAAALGIRTNAVSRIAHHARQLGDKRAARRRAPHGQAGTGDVIAGAWVPFYADPRQVALPVELPELAPPPPEPPPRRPRRPRVAVDPHAELPFRLDPRQQALPFGPAAASDSGAAS